MEFLGNHIPTKLTTTQRDDISSPIEGMIIYNTDEKMYQFYNGTIWGNVDTTGGAGVSTIVSTIDSISMTSINNHLLYEVTSGKQFIAQRVIVRLTSISGGGAVPKISIGTNAATYDNIYSNTSLSGLTTLLDGYSISIEGTFRIAQSDVGVYIIVNNASTYTSYVCSIDLIGFEI